MVQILLLVFVALLLYKLFGSNKISWGAVFAPVLVIIALPVVVFGLFFMLIWFGRTFG